MGEPFFRAITPDGRTSVEVHIPEGVDAEAEIAVDGEVLFRCSVSIDGKYETDKLETNSLNYMLSWTERQMKEAMRRSAPSPSGEGNGLDNSRSR